MFGFHIFKLPEKLNRNKIPHSEYIVARMISKIP